MSDEWMTCILMVLNVILTVLNVLVLLFCIKELCVNVMCIDGSQCFNDMVLC